jgi:hypothetical protein
MLNQQQQAIYSVSSAANRIEGSFLVYKKIYSACHEMFDLQFFHQATSSLATGLQIKKVMF